MADKITETPQLIPPMQPGVDNGQHPKEMREVIAKNIGGSMVSVTPSGEIAEQVFDNARTDFLEKVANVPQSSDQTLIPQNTDSSEMLSDVKENIEALLPGEQTVRTEPSQKPFNLGAARQKKMADLKEAA